MTISREIKEVRGAFSSFSIVYVGRDANQAAHLCVKQASVGFVANTLLSDCNLID
jgi:hypothetical protein